MVAEGLHIVEHWAHNLAVAGGFVALVASIAYNGLFGVVAGGVIVGVYLGFKRLLPRREGAH